MEQEKVEDEKELDEEVNKVVRDLMNEFVSVLKMPELVSKLIELFQEFSGDTSPEMDKIIEKYKLSSEVREKLPELMKDISDQLGAYFQLLSSYVTFRTLEKQNEVLDRQASLIKEQNGTTDKLLRTNRILAFATVVLASATTVSVILGAVFHL